MLFMKAVFLPLGPLSNKSESKMSSYCDYASGDPLHGPYHDTEYGFPERDEAKLFERLTLEMNQAGLNWGLILKKREGFRLAYKQFDVEAVAAFDDADRERLLADARIIRNKLKVNAAINNAQVILSMRETHGGFASWLDAHHPMSKDAWVKLFKKTFRFTGGEITGEFLKSTGYLPGAHKEECPVFSKIAQLSPPWMTAA